jgi:hypothetical protein
MGIVVPVRMTSLGKGAARATACLVFVSADALPNRLLSHSTKPSPKSA